MTTALSSGWSSWFTRGEDPDEEIPGLVEADAVLFVRSVLALLQQRHFRGVFYWDGRSEIELTSPGGTDFPAITVCLSIRAYGPQSVGTFAGTAATRSPLCAVMLRVERHVFFFHKEAVPCEPGMRSVMITADMIAAVALHAVTELSRDQHAQFVDETEPVPA